jgi:hypothetical protein
MANLDHVLLFHQARQAIEQDIAQRTKIHQATVARIKTAAGVLRAAGAPTAPTTPLAMLAHGDSWFDYPLSGNGPSFSDTDIVAQLGSMGNINPVILNISHYGDATTEEMSLPKQQRMIEAIQDPSNWFTGMPDAILFSGGGDDIAGNQFCIFLNYALPGANGLNPARFDKVLGMIEASYSDLFAFRDRYAPGVPIFGHAYDFAIPNGVHPLCAGPWLKPSLDYAGWSIAQGTAIVREALAAFQALLSRLAGVAANNFILVDTQGTLAPPDWANELHPYPGGFQALAGKFVQALQAKFPGRI